MNEGELYTQYSATKKKYLSTDLFFTSCGFFVHLCVFVCVCVCVCVCYLCFMYVSLYTMLLEVVVVIMALSSRPEVNLLRVRKSL